MKYKHWAVEVHIGKDVLMREFKEKECAQRCYDRLIAAGQSARIWYRETLVNANC